MTDVSARVKKRLCYALAKGCSEKSKGLKNEEDLPCRRGKWVLLLKRVF